MPPQTKLRMNQCNMEAIKTETELENDFQDNANLIQLKKESEDVDKDSNLKVYIKAETLESSPFEDPQEKKQDGPFSFMCLNNIMRETDSDHFTKIEEDFCSENKYETSADVNEVVNDKQLCNDVNEEGKLTAPITGKKKRMSKKSRKKPAEESPHVCTTCNIQYNSANSLWKHMLNHREKTYVCPICSKKFSQKCSLDDHLRGHTGEKPFSCKICNKTFARTTNLNVHVRTHSDERPFECIVCNNKFKNSDNLSRHMRVHTGEKPFQCDICEKKFSKSYKLTCHKRIHTGEKPYECNMCGKKFSKSENLNQHKRIHTGNKPFECSLCFMKFMDENKLKRHMRTHSDVKPHWKECQVCGRKLHPDSITRHMKTHTVNSEVISPKIAENCV